MSSYAYRLQGEIMQAVRDAVRARSFEQDGKVRLTCAAAFALAEELDVKLSAIADICKEENIRISNCRLGCF